MASIAGMKHLGKVVRQLRIARGLTLEAVANQVPEYDSGNLSRFERGLQDIALPKLEALAHVLQTPMHEMMRTAGELDDAAVHDSGLQLIASENLPPAFAGLKTLQVVPPSARFHTGSVQGVVRMPVLTDAQVASLAESSDALGAASEHIETSSDLGAGAFAWRVQDDSMTGEGSLSFAPGMTVLFQPMAAHTAGDCVMVRLSATEVQFCQLTRAGGAWYMSSLNRRYQPRELPRGAVVLGVAVAAQFKVPRGGT